ncbi:MAG: hypothetical protein WB952_04545 [Terriglobales bacterium]
MFLFSRPARLILLLPILFLASPALASPWQASEIQLARKISAVIGPGEVALDVVNVSSLKNKDADEILHGLLNELSSLGLHSVPPDQAAATIRVTLSENLQDYVWVAEIRQGNKESSVVMVATSRPDNLAWDHPVSALSLHKALIWMDDNRILDVALPVGNPAHMIVLEPESVLLYVLQSGHWQQENAFAITHPRPWPRDLRGRLVLRKDHLFDAYLPGVLCRSSTTAPLAINCRESDDPWPLAPDPPPLSAFFAPTRNFFTGVFSPGIQKQTATSPFYSAASLPRDKYTLWVFATVDGQVHWLDGMTDQVTGNLGWGSDIVSLHSGCGSGWQILATEKRGGRHDTLTAFEVADRDPVVVSQPEEFSGGISALWTDADSATAIVIVQDSEAGKYEAYRISPTCGQ